MVFNKTDGQYYTWTGTEWSIVAKNINLKMTNYELNQQVMSQMKILPEEEIINKLKNVGAKIEITE